jgi:mono/diheme cytochrome c family protein
VPSLKDFGLLRSWRWSIKPFDGVRSAPRFLSGSRLLGLGVLALVSAGCRQDMHNQPKFYPQRSTTFFANGRSVRPQVDHTVARGQLHEDSFFYTGLVDGKEADAMPFPATMTVLQRGQERYNIYCTPCHSRVGNGAGMIVQRGYKAAGNFHSARILAEPLGHYFYVITNGYGAMPDYSAQITPADRWAVAAYIRALQVSQNARENDVPSGTQVENLKDITEKEGLPESWAAPWTLPPTAVSALPPDPNAGDPGNAPATGDSAFPAMSQPNAGSATNGNLPKPNGLKPATR